MNMNERDLMTALRTIGALQANDRLDTTGAKLEIQKPSMYNSFMRTFVWPQSRATCAERVVTVVDNAKTTVEAYCQRLRLAKADLDVLELLSTAMAGAVAGLRHLAETYMGTSAGESLALCADNLRIYRANLEAVLRDHRAGKRVPAHRPRGPASEPARDVSRAKLERPRRRPGQRPGQRPGRGQASAETDGRRQRSARACTQGALRDTTERAAARPTGTGTGIGTESAACPTVHGTGTGSGTGTESAACPTGSGTGSAGTGTGSAGTGTGSAGGPTGTGTGIGTGTGAGTESAACPTGTGTGIEISTERAIAEDAIASDEDDDYADAQWLEYKDDEEDDDDDEFFDP